MRLKQSMRRAPLVMTAAVALLALQACASIPSGRVQIDLADPPPRIAARCDNPVQLPERDLSRVEVEKLWARDISALVRCGLTKQQLHQFYDTQQTALEGAGA
jgi:hypothetical protein